MTWVIAFTSAADKDYRKRLTAAPRLYEKTRAMLEKMREEPLYPGDSLEKLVGDLKGCWSRRINKQHRLVFMLRPDEKPRTVRVLSCWSHYGD